LNNASFLNVYSSFVTGTPPYAEIIPQPSENYNGGISPIGTLRASCGTRPPPRVCSCCCPEFQSTRPVGGATRNRCSTHTGHGGFNPRAPWGARPCTSRCFGSYTVFQSTRPTRGATCQRPAALQGQRFQSTRPVGGATCRNKQKRRGVY
jgi:hypothetical protein